MTLYQLSQQFDKDVELHINDVFGYLATSEELRNMYLSLIGDKPDRESFDAIKLLLGKVKTAEYISNLNGSDQCFITMYCDVVLSKIIVIVDKVNNCIYDFFTYIDTADFFKKLDTRQIENGVTFDDNFDILRLTKEGAIKL